MKSTAETVKKYIDQLPEGRKEIVIEIRNVILDNLPEGFEECMNYGMIGYVVPFSLYPSGYHCDPTLPLPFMNLASQKNFIGFYHMGIYGDEQLKQWFSEEYAKVCKYKLDMGKSCIRLKKMDDIPYELLGVLCKKINPGKWIADYEKFRQKTD